MLMGGSEMQLTRVERWMLANQYRIRAILEPDYTDDFNHAAQALEDGYEHEYDHLAKHINHDGLSDADGDFVQDVMQMYMLMQMVFDQLSEEEKVEVGEHRVVFPGFDGNNETMQMAYARWIVEDPMQFKSLRAENRNFNSHRRTLGRYQIVLGRWEEVRPKNDYTKEDLLYVLDGKV